MRAAEDGSGGCAQRHGDVRSARRGGAGDGRGDREIPARERATVACIKVRDEELPHAIRRGSIKGRHRIIKRAARRGRSEDGRGAIETRFIRARSHRRSAGEHRRGGIVESQIHPRDRCAAARSRVEQHLLPAGPDEQRAGVAGVSVREARERDGDFCDHARAACDGDVRRVWRAGAGVGDRDGSSVGVARRRRRARRKREGELHHAEICRAVVELELRLVCAAEWAVRAEGKLPRRRAAARCEHSVVLRCARLRHAIGGEQRGDEICRGETATVLQAEGHGHDFGGVYLVIKRNDGLAHERQPIRRDVRCWERRGCCLQRVRSHEQSRAGIGIYPRCFDLQATREQRCPHLRGRERGVVGFQQRRNRCRVGCRCRGAVERLEAGHAGGDAIRRCEIGLLAHRAATCEEIAGRDRRAIRRVENVTRPVRAEGLHGIRRAARESARERRGSRHRRHAKCACCRRVPAHISIRAHRQPRAACIEM